MSETTEIATQVKRRRTFAIISHPDAGKTTLTEKLLLFSGAIQIAGSVKARNLRDKPRVALALEDGDHPYVVEGQARPIVPDASVIELFKKKYD